MAQTEIRLSEIEEHMRRIAYEVMAEQANVLRKEMMEGELGKLRLELGTHLRHVWETIAELAEAQKRTEERVNELTEAQRYTEETVRQLVEAQRRMEESLVRLDRQLAETSKQVGQLANRLGLDLEVDAEEILREALKKKDFELLQEPFPIVVDGEADVVAPVRSPEGEMFWILVEVKGRVRRSEVGDWLRQLNRADFQERLREVQVDKPYLPYIFGLRIYPGVEEMAKEAGLGVLDHRGERVSARPWR